jgi:tripartite-type tricarboxylate transporter receptor subunit TctC
LIGHVKGGKLKALGIAAPKRHPALPDVPTFMEQGVGGVDSNNWYALFVPAKTLPTSSRRSTVRFATCSRHPR